MNWAETDIRWGRKVMWAKRHHNYLEAEMACGRNGLFPFIIVQWDKVNTVKQRVSSHMSTVLWACDTTITWKMLQEHSIVDLQHKCIAGKLWEEARTALCSFRTDRRHCKDAMLVDFNLVTGYSNWRLNYCIVINNWILFIHKWF